MFKDLSRLEIKKILNYLWMDFSGILLILMLTNAKFFNDSQNERGMQNIQSSHNWI